MLNMPKELWCCRNNYGYSAHEEEKAIMPSDARYINADYLSDKYAINRHKFLQTVDAILAYHNEDREFCRNFEGDIQEMLKDAFV